MKFSKRVDSLRKILKNNNADFFLTTFSPHLKYLVNYSGSNGVALIFKDEIIFATDFRYEVSAKSEVVADKIIVENGNLFAAISKYLKSKKFKIQIDSRTLSVQNFRELKKYFHVKKIIFSDGVVEQISSVKEKSEIELIKKAISISEKTFNKVLEFIKVGITELEISALISFYHKKFGAESDSFLPIVASGINGAKPHAGATNKKIRKGEMITLDFGCFYKNYASDITRTISIGNPKSEMKKIYNIVNEANKIGILESKNGVASKKIDEKVRDFITKSGYGDNFKHSLGHGIGLQIHEKPMLSKLSKSKIEIGNVITIEPGIYLPKIGGVRIEDDVLIKKNGNEVLTKLNKELIIL